MANDKPVAERCAMTIPVAGGSSHTPSPWKIEKYSDDGVRDAERIRSANGLIVVHEVWGASLSECDANYRLIAAAPDLLEALREMVAGFGFAVQGGLTAKLIERAQAAIAKAEKP